MANKTTPAIQNLRGNIGIGEVNPLSKLHVDNADTSANQLALRLDQRDPSAAIANFYQAGTETHSFTTTGTNSGVFTIKSGGSNVVSISTNGVSYLNGGNVGIGTTSPSYLLDVNGSSRVTTMAIRSGGFGQGYNSYTQHALGQLTIQSGLGGLGEGGAADHLLFNAPDLYEVTTTQGGAYADVTSTYEGTYKNLFTGQKTNVNITASSIYSLRMTWDGIGYKFFDTLYVPCSFRGNTMDVTIEEYDGTNWNTVATRTGLSGWEGRNVYINGWNNASHQQKLRLTFDINWNNSNNATFYRIAYYGGYPAGSEVRLFTWNYERNVAFVGSSITIGSTLYLDNNEIWAKNGNNLNVKADADVVIQPGAATTATFKSGGNVGIGTTNPSAPLSISNGGAEGIELNYNVGNEARILSYNRSNNTYRNLILDSAYHRFKIFGNEVGSINGSGNVTFNNNLTVGGIVTAQEFHTEFVSASIIYQSGSTQFGDTSDDTHEFTGTVNVEGDDTAFKVSNINSNGSDTGIEIQGARNGAVGTATSYIHFTNQDDNSGGLHNLARIYGAMASTGDNDGTLTLQSWNGSTYSTGIHINEDGKVGVGTFNTANRFGVNGDAQIGSNGSANAFGRLQVNQDANNDESGIGILSSGEARSMRLWVDESVSYISSGDGGGGILSLNQGGGNVGIGTNAPTRPLSVYRSTAGSAANFLHYTSAAAFAGLYIDVDNVNNIVELNASGDTASTMAFQVGNSEKMRIATSGTVGINTTAPSSVNKLEVHGQARIVGAMMIGTSATSNGVASNTALHIKNSAEAARIRIEDSDSDNQYYDLYVNSGSGFSINEGTNTRMFFEDTTGNVGIGTTTPENKLHILSSTTDATQQLLIQNGSSGDAAIKFNISGDTYSLGIDNSDGDKFKLSAGNLGTNDRIVVDSTGNVGIGTTSPSAKLDVAGTAVINGTYRGGTLQVNDYNSNIDGARIYGYSNNEMLSLISRYDQADGGLFFKRGTNGSETTIGQINFVSNQFRIDASIGSFLIETGGTAAVGINSSQTFQLSQYGSGNKTGTPVYNLQVDSSGNIIETAAAATSAVGGSGVADEVAVWSSGANVSGSQAFTWNGDVLFIDGVMEAREKSFNIKHPTKENKRLIYGVLEGPEHGVYVRGKIESNVIELPEEWVGLVDEDSITVQLTSIGSHQNLYVSDIKDNKIFIKNGNTFTNKIKAFYYVQGTRKDVKPLVTERDA